MTATMTPDLFLAILAMDSYNRGYAAGVTMPSASLGNVTISTTYDDPNAGFSATAYNINGGVPGLTDAFGNPVTTVISYRGTDNPSLGENTLAGASDIIEGWIAGAGVQTSQTNLGIVDK